MRYIAGERLWPGDPVYVDPSDGTVRRVRIVPTESVVVLEGGPEDGRTMRYDWGLPHTIQIEDSWTPVDALNGHLDEYVNTGRLDNSGRVIYEFRRQRYTAEGGAWGPVP